MKEAKAKELDVPSFYLWSTWQKIIILIKSINLVLILFSD